MREKNSNDPNKNISRITDGVFDILLAIIPISKNDMVTFSKL